jgi:Carboxypeptidase regulatory-like domain/CarboxypepD_reg-like domain
VVTAFVRIDLADRSPDFQRIALEPGVPLLDRGQTTARLLRVWLGRFVGEPEWVDAQTVQFYLNDEQGRRIDPKNLQLVTSRDLKGVLRSEVKAIRDRLAQVQPRGRTEQTALNLMRDRFENLVKQPEQAYSDGAFYRYRDHSGKWRIVWCWGFQRSESKIVRPAVCVKPDCRRVYLVRNAEDPKCSKCQTPMPVFRFPWRRVGLMAACLIMALTGGGWWYWNTRPRSSIEGQVHWSGFNVPVAGATIQIESLNVAVQSDKEGRFRVAQLPAGSLDLTIKADGFRELQLTRKLGQAQDVSLSVDLTGDGVLAGRVLDAVSHQPVPDARIQIVGTSESIVSNETGLFRRMDCRRGPLKLEVSARGYPIVEREVTVAQANADPIAVELTGDAILVGQVVNTTQDKPLADVRVRLEGSGQTAMTDADGWYAFRQAPFGKQEVVVEFDGYATERIEKELVSKQERQASFKLAGAAKVSGSVVRDVDMSPMSGVAIKLVGTKMTAKTDDDGRFELKGISAGKATIEVSMPGFATESFDRELSNTEETNLPVKLRGDATIVGQVTDQLTGLPILEADVRLPGLPYQTKTDSDGKYRLEGVPSLPAKLDARTSGYIAKTMDIKPAAKEETSVPFVLLGNSTISGVVLERWTDAPVAGAKFALGTTALPVTTSDEGSFEIKGVRGGVTHELRVEADGLAPQMEEIDAKPGPTTPVKIVLSGTGKLAGRVVSAIDESPVAGASVQLTGTKHRVMTDAKGAFVLDKLQAGRVSIEVAATGFELRRVTQDVTDESRPVSILLGGNASVTGDVIDAATGLPIPDAEIHIAKTLLKATSSELGTFRLEGAFPGKVTLTTKAAGYPDVSQQVELPAEREVKSDFLLAGTASIAGEVYDDVGKPVENAIVQLEDTTHKVTTGPRGEFQLARLRSGTPHLSITAPMFARKSVSVDVKTGEAKSLGRIMLLSSLTLKGQVVNAVTGEPLPNAKLSIASPVLQATADAQGQFQFENLPAKMHSIKIELAGFVTDTVSVNPAGDSEPELYCLCPILKPDEVVMVLTWRGGVADLDAHMFRATADKSDAHVFSAQPQSDNLSVEKSNANGRGPETLRIHPLKPGRYEIVVSVESNEDVSKDPATALQQLSKSEATLKIYRFGATAPQLFRVGRNKKATVWWPLAIEINDSGKLTEHIYKAEHYRTTLPLEIRSH